MGAIVHGLFYGAEVGAQQSQAKVVRDWNRARRKLLPLREEAPPGLRLVGFWLALAHDGGRPEIEDLEGRTVYLGELKLLKPAAEAWLNFANFAQAHGFTVGVPGVWIVPTEIA